MRKLMAVVILSFTIKQPFFGSQFVASLAASGIDLGASGSTMTNGEFRAGGSSLTVKLFDVSKDSAVVTGALGTGFKAGHSPLPGLNDPVMISSYTATIQAAIRATGG